MKQSIKPWLLFLSVTSYIPLSAISMVYNFRIAQITRQSLLDQENNRNKTVLGLLFDQFQQKHTDSHQNFAGGLTAFMRHFGSNYFRTDFAVSHIKDRTDGSTTFSGTQSDDLLFTIGHHFELNKQSELILSGLFGVPTHKVTTLEHASFGYGQIGAGVQLDGSYTLHHHDKNALLYGVRYLYFVPRTARDTEGKHHTFSIGNITDILCAYKDWWNKHGLELGFTQRFNFGAHCSPNFDDILERTNYIRSNFYAVYKYKFLIRDVPNRLLFNIAYGFDEKSKKFGNKYIVTLWTSWSVNF